MDSLSKISTIIGTVGGITGFISWIKTNKKETKSFNQTTYTKSLKYTFKDCFENTNCPETENVNMFNLWCLINNIREFRRLNNNFDGWATKQKFKDLLLYADVIRFDNFTGFNWFFTETDKNNEHTIQDYTEKKIHIQRLKPFFLDFYTSIFTNID